jgi:hypothetical protein
MRQRQKAKEYQFGTYKGPPAPLEWVIQKMYNPQ